MTWVGKAVYDFQASSLEEVDLLKGDIVRVSAVPHSDLLSKHWCFGAVHGRGTGRIPVSCLAKIAPPPIRATFEDGDVVFIAGEGFTGTDPSQDLAFSKGEFVVGRIKLNDEWMFGHSADGTRSGRFPLSRVLPVNEEDSRNPSSVSTCSPASAKRLTGKAVVVENVTGQLPGELTVRKGDKVEILEAESDFWYRCRLADGTSGLLSSQVVRPLDEPRAVTNEGGNIETGIVIHNFVAEFDNELSCASGEKVEILDRIGGDWVRARSFQTGQEGLIPGAFVQLAANESGIDAVPHLQIPITSQHCVVPADGKDAIGSLHSEKNPIISSVAKRMRVLYDFEPECAGDMRLVSGDFVEFVSYCDDENWIRARDPNTGVVGVCPASYVADEASPGKSGVGRQKPFSPRDFALATTGTGPGKLLNIDDRIKRNLVDISAASANAGNRNLYANAPGYDPPSSTDSSMVSGRRDIRSPFSSDVQNMLLDVDFDAGKTHESSQVKYDTLSGLFAGHDPSSLIGHWSSHEPDAMPSANVAPDVREVPPSDPRPAAVSVVAAPKFRPPIPERPSLKPVSAIIEEIPPEKGEGADGSSTSYPDLREHDSVERVDCGGGGGGGGGSVTGSDTPKSNRSVKSNLSLSESQDGGDASSISGSGMDRRDHVVREILSAERDYIRHLKTTVEVFGLPDAPVLEEHGMDSSAVFGNILQVIEVAENLEKALAVNVEGVEPSEQRIGSCFLALKNELEDAYLKYCLHYSKASALLTRYNSVQKRKELLDELAYNIRSRDVKCLNLDSILMEPVQHVLKYHLLLSELIKATDQSHADMVDLWEAHRVALERNSKINETGRLTELLEKYSKTCSKSGKMAHVSMRSISKGAGRIATSVAASLGLASETKCAVFEERGKRFRDVDECIRSFRKWVSKFIDDFGALLKLELSLCDGFVRLLGGGEGASSSSSSSKPPEEVDRFWGVHYEVLSNVWPNFRRQLGVQVLSPLGVLSDKLDQPRFLVDKRRDKLLDYDKLRNKMAKVREPTAQMREELDTAQKTYEALNALLIEELPAVCDICHEVLARCFLNFFSIRKRLCGKISSELMNLSKFPLLSSDLSNIYNNFFTQHKLVCAQMSRLSLLAVRFQEEPVANSLFLAAGGGGDPGAGRGVVPRRPSKSPKAPAATAPLRQNSSPTPSSTSNGVGGVSRSGSVALDATAAAARVRSKFPPEKTFRVERDFPGPKEDLSPAGAGAGAGSGLPPNFADLLLRVSRGDLVGVVKRELPSGGSSHWFVDNGVTQGFLPRDVLKPEAQRRQSAAAAVVPARGRGQPAAPARPQPPSVVVDQSHLYDEPPSYDETMAANAAGRLPASSRYENVDLPSGGGGGDGYGYGRPNPEKPPPPRKAASVSEGAAGAAVRVLYPYAADSDVELTVGEGEVLVVVGVGDNAGNREWLYVENSSGRRGYVPAAFVAPAAVPPPSAVPDSRTEKPGKK